MPIRLFSQNPEPKSYALRTRNGCATWWLEPTLLWLIPKMNMKNSAMSSVALFSKSHSIPERLRINPSDLPKPLKDELSNPAIFCGQILLPSTDPDLYTHTQTDTDRRGTLWIVSSLILYLRGIRMDTENPGENRSANHARFKKCLKEWQNRITRRTTGKYIYEERFRDCLTSGQTLISIAKWSFSKSVI